jgi:GntR family transcriptional regulator/MocR family aminotransferase
MKKLWYENFRLTGDKITFSRQIQVQIEAKIKKGIGPHNLRMPGIRELANSLSKHNKVDKLYHDVESAYKALCKAGILYTKGKIGTFISPEAFPDENTTVPSKQVADFSFNKQQLPENTFITLGPYYPDHQVLDLPKPSLLYEELHECSTEYPAQTNPIPDRDFHSLIHREVRSRCLNIQPSHLAIIPGAGMALKIVLRSLLKREDKVILSRKCNPRVKELIRSTGAEIIEINSDQQGIKMTEIEANCKATRIKLVYVEPAGQYPDMIYLTPNRRNRLLQLSDRHNFAIIEHDEEHGCYYSTPGRSLFDKDEKAKVIYISSLNRHTPWLHKLGFVLAPKNFIDHILIKSRYLYETWDVHFERALIKLLEKGIFQGIIRKVNSWLSMIQKKVKNLFKNMQLTKYAVLSDTKAGIFLFIHFPNGINALIPKLIDSEFYDPPDQNLTPQHEITGLRISLYLGSQTRFSNLFKILKAHFMKP